MYTHYYDGGGVPLCRVTARTWSWSVDLRAVTCPACLDALGEQMRLAFPTTPAPRDRPVDLSAAYGPPASA